MQAVFFGAKSMSVKLLTVASRLMMLYANTPSGNKLSQILEYSKNVKINFAKVNLATIHTTIGPSDYSHQRFVTS